MFVGLVRLVRIFVQEVDEREVNCLSTLVLIEAAWYELSFLAGFLRFFIFGSWPMVRFLAPFSARQSFCCERNCGCLVRSLSVNWNILSWTKYAATFQFMYLPLQYR